MAMRIRPQTDWPSKFLDVQLLYSEAMYFCSPYILATVRPGYLWLVIVSYDNGVMVSYICYG